MKQIVLVLSVLVLPLITHALVEPTIQKRQRKVGTVQLGSDVEAKLKTFDPNFRLFKATEFIPAVQEIFATEAEDGETPMAVVADFNGDKIRDVAVIGHNGKEQLVLGVISTGNGYQVQVIERDLYFPATRAFHPPMVESDVISDEAEYERWRQQGVVKYVAVVKSIAETPRAQRNDGTKRFATDALMVDAFLAASTRLIYFKDGNFREWKPQNNRR